MREGQLAQGGIVRFYFFSVFRAPKAFFGVEGSTEEHPENLSAR